MEIALGIIIVALVLTVLYFRSKINRIAAEAQFDIREVKGQITNLGKTASEWNEVVAKEVLELRETTLKANINKHGELVITSPDGSITYDEFKVKKTK